MLNSCQHRGFVRILPCFYEEMMVQEDPIRIGEDDSLKQKKQIKVEHISRLYRRLMLRPIDYTVDWEDTEKKNISISRLIHRINQLLSRLVG